MGSCIYQVAPGEFSFDATCFENKKTRKISFL